MTGLNLSCPEIDITKFMTGLLWSCPEEAAYGLTYLLSAYLVHDWAPIELPGTNNWLNFLGHDGSQFELPGQATYCKARLNGLARVPTSLPKTCMMQAAEQREQKPCLHTIRLYMNGLTNKHGQECWQ